MGDLVLSNARVLDGRGGIAQRATVRLSGSRVAEVLPGYDAKMGGPEAVDLSGMTLMPALVDAHVHLSSYPTLPQPLRGEEPRSGALRYFELANFALSPINEPKKIAETVADAALTIADVRGVERF
jgi:cytosine/adenosine deaminase-related metal-dependent hydrolase